MPPVGNELGVAERKRGWEQVLAVLDVGIGLEVRLLGFVVRLRIPVLEGPVRLDGGEVRSVHRVVVVEVHGEEDDPLVALDVHHPKMPYDADGIVLVALPIVDLLAVEPLRHHAKPPRTECPPAALLQVVRQSAELLQETPGRPDGGVKVLFEYQFHARDSTRKRSRALRRRFPGRTNGAGVCKHRGGGEHRAREVCFALRSVRSPHENRIGFCFPCSARSRSCSAFSTGLQDRQESTGGVWRGAGRSPARQTRKRAAECRWMPRSKQGRLCVLAALCVPFERGAWRRLAPAAPSLVRTMAGSGSAPCRGLPRAARLQRRREVL